MKCESLLSRFQTIFSGQTAPASWCTPEESPINWANILMEEDMKKLYLGFSAILLFAFCLLNCGTPVPKDVTKQQFANGLTVIVKSNPDSKVLGINILGKNRSAMEPEGKTGIADFVNRMLLKGTKNRSAEKISEDFYSVGAEITLVDNPWIPYDDVYTTHSYTFIKFQTIDEFADKGIELLSDIVKDPVFPEEEIEKVRKEMMMLLGRRKGSTRESVRDLFYSTLFEDHPYGKPIMGTPRTIGSITREDLVSFHQEFYSPNNMIVSVVTNFPAQEMMGRIQNAFGEMQRVDFPLPNIVAPPELTAPVKAQNIMEKEQVYIYLGGPLPGIFSADVPALKVMNSILSSRLGLNLREKQGLAYSVGSSVRSFSRKPGIFYVGKRIQRGGLRLRRQIYSAYKASNRRAGEAGGGKVSGHGELCAGGSGENVNRGRGDS